MFCSGCTHCIFCYIFVITLQMTFTNAVRSKARLSIRGKPERHTTAVGPTADHAGPQHPVAMSMVHHRLTFFSPPQYWLITHSQMSSFPTRPRPHPLFLAVIPHYQNDLDNPPNKDETLIKRWFNAGPALQRLGQHSIRLGQYIVPCSLTTRCICVASLLGRRRR